MSGTTPGTEAVSEKAVFWKTVVELQNKLGI